MAGKGAMKNQQIPNSKTFDFDERELVMKMMISQKPGIDLIQNCDLPPPNPMKVNRNSFNLMGTEEIGDDRDGKLGLLRALRLSQTRAREAEAKCASMAKERESLVLAFMEDSMQLFGYRQLVRLLDFQVSKLQQQKEEDGGSLTWIMAMAFCFGVAGFGFALGFNYYYYYF